jgi:phosphomannomutase
MIQAPKQEEFAEYLCPGQRHPIPRAVHLGRLARFYPGCRQCAHRDDTGTLSEKQVVRLVETRLRAAPRSLFHEEGAEGVYRNDLRPGAARDMAAALGVLLLRPPLPLGEGWGEGDRVEGFASGASPPVVALAGDGRPLSADLVAAVSEGLRWSGCHVIDIGPASAGCLTFAIGYLQATGGILVGNPGVQAHTAGLKFWAPGPQPLSAGGPLEALEQCCRAGADRPTRTYGSLRRFQAEVAYLATLAPYYHALRPLRLVLDSACGPLVGYLQHLTGAVACEIIPCRVTREQLAEQVLADRAHFAACIEGDGETCLFLDEQGRPVSAERMLLVFARQLLAESPRGALVLEHDTAAEVGRAIEVLGGRVVTSGPRRGQMAAAMRAHGALLGGGPSGRFWYGAAPPLPDALLSLTLLLRILSQSDRRFSEVLDRGAPIGYK